MSVDARTAGDQLRETRSARESSTPESIRRRPGTTHRERQYVRAERKQASKNNKAAIQERGDGPLGRVVTTRNRCADGLPPGVVSRRKLTAQCLYTLRFYRRSTTLYRLTWTSQQILRLSPFITLKLAPLL